MPLGQISLCDSKISQNILFACYNDNLTAEQISLEIGVSLPYMEDKLNELCDYEVLKKDGNKYYTTGTVVIQNTGEEGSVLSITNLKWTFSQNGGKGYFRIPTPVENETVSVASSASTPRLAYSLQQS